MAAALVGLAVQVGAGGREDPLPDPLAAGARVLASEGPGQLHPARASADVGFVLVADRLEVLGEVTAGGGGQHRHAILGAFAGAHRDLVAPEVHVLHPQAQGFEQPQAGAIQEQRREARGSVERVDDDLHLRAGQHDRDALGILGPHDVVEPRQLLLENLAIEEEQRAQRLVLRGRGDIAVDGQIAQEARDLGGAHLGRMALAVEDDVAPDPSDVGLLRAEAAVAGA